MDALNLKAFYARYEGGGWMALAGASGPLTGRAFRIAHLGDDKPMMPLGASLRLGMCKVFQPAPAPAPAPALCKRRCWRFWDA